MPWANRAVIKVRLVALQMATVYQLPEASSIPDSFDGLAQSDMTFDEPAYALSPGEQGDFDSPVLRVLYSSLTTPRTVIDQHMTTGER